MNKIRFIAFISILICLLIVIPAGFAVDNETVIAGSNDSQDSILASVPDDALSTNDYYFDANINNDSGNGSIDNPYKYLNSDRIQQNSIIHLADGQYDLDKYTDVNNLTIVGQNVDRTIITFYGIGFDVSDSLTLKNLTLINLGIEDNSNAILTANNVIFKNSRSSAITADLKNTEINLDNCTFMNNFANSGGAISISQGYLTVMNTLFIGNEAEFFGGAISALNSTLRISNSTFRDNKARFDGGSIYCLDGNISISDSDFINNSAKNGGAFLIDVSRSTYIDSNRFINNTASDYAGAFCLMYNDNITVNDNYYENNGASDYPNEYISNFFQIFIGDGNYTMLMNDDISFDGEIPSFYSLKDEGYVTPVKNQGSSGSFWSFASLAVLESCIKKVTGWQLDLSENNMKNLITNYSYYGYTKLDANSGGYASTGYNYLIGWLGPVNESDDPFVASSIMSPLLHSIFHVQNVMFLQRSSYTDNDGIKKAIMKYGGVNTQLFFTKNKYQYYTGDKAANHAVCIVGWNLTALLEKVDGLLKTAMVLDSETKDISMFHIMIKPVSRLAGWMQVIL